MARVMPALPAVVSRGRQSESAAKALALPVRAGTQTSPPSSMPGGANRDEKRFIAFSIFIIHIQNDVSISKYGGFDELMPDMISPFF
jgi:hypothetical protein